MIAISSFILWLRLFELLAVMTHTGPLVHMIIVMLRDDLLKFLQVAVVMLLGYACSMQLLVATDEHSVASRMIEAVHIAVVGYVACTSHFARMQRLLYVW